MQQITLELDSEEAADPSLTMDPQRVQRLMAVMAEAIIAVRQSQGGQSDESD